ncbi:MAG: O-antigen ligase family protein [Pseudomonadota bacterium]|nr:O-antigen ligase family protein [Pseudomonadota bacterium]
MFTLCAIFFLLWALISLGGEKPRIDRSIAYLYGWLIVAFALGVPGGAEPANGIAVWAKFLAYSSGIFIILASLQRVPDGIARLGSGFAVSGLFVLVTLYFMLFVQIGQPNFDPVRQLLEDNLPFLTLFILYYLQHRGCKPWNPLVLLCLAATIGYVVLAQGRAALLGLVVGLMCYGGLVLKWRARSLAGAAIIMSALAGLYAGEYFKGQWTRHAILKSVDDLTSQRSVLWRQAIASPPDNLLIGVGMGNAHRNKVIMRMEIGPLKRVKEAKHLHNFLLDAWYETGIIGLMSLLAWLGLMLRRGVRAWRSAEGFAQQQAGLFLAGSMAILTSALFSFSYRSKPFAIYLFIFLAALAFLDQSRRTLP